MPFATCDGIETRYEVYGEGPPLLLFSPGGFDATIENWSTFGIYQRLDLLDNLASRYACIAFDKRESGQSGGRVEPLTWEAYARQGLALLDHLDLEHAHLLGGCIGCSIVLTAATLAPERVGHLVLYSPAGGPHYRRTQLGRLDTHAEYVREHGLEAALALPEATFAKDPRRGPWARVANGDEASYLDAVEQTKQLFDRDTVPGPDAETLMRLEHPALIAPGNDASHALSAAHYLAECLPNAELWDALPPEQSAETAPRKILDFLEQ